MAARSPLAQFCDPIHRVLSSANSIFVCVPSEMLNVPLTVFVASGTTDSTPEKYPSFSNCCPATYSVVPSLRATVAPGTATVAVTGVVYVADVGYASVRIVAVFAKFTFGTASAPVPPHSRPQLKM